MYSILILGEKVMRTWLFAIAAGVIASSSIAAEVGLPVGATAPDFSLQDQHGQTHKLSELAKRSKVALVFFRSADW